MSQINHPKYYIKNGIEVIDLIDAYNLNFNCGNVIKYVARAGFKDGEDKLTAYNKALWYLQHEISNIQRSLNDGSKVTHEA